MRRLRTQGRLAAAGVLLACFVAGAGVVRVEAQSSDGGSEEAAIDRLGRQALALLDSDRGDAASCEAIQRPLERSYDQHRARLDAMAKGVIDADGDMDALFATPDYKEHQALASQALYYLNWLNYRCALFYGGAKRKDLLEKAASGFGEFATATSDHPVVIESKLGHGLAALELDHPEWAIADFEAVAQSKTASPDKIGKARLALAEAYFKAGRSADALRASKDAVANASPSDRARAEYTRARALLMAAASQPAQKSTYQAEAQSLLLGLQAQGGPWGERAGGVLKAGLDNPKNWAGPKAPPPAPPPPSEWDVTKKLFADGKYKEVIPRVDKVIAADDPEAREHRREAQYFLGVARLRTGDPAGALVPLDAVLADKGKAYYRDDAAYLRFKAEEAIYTQNPTEERLPAYEAALTTFARDYPGHKAASEAAFRLGELRQKQDRLPEAIAQFAKVKGDPSFELRAAFGSAQAAVRLLERTPEGKAPDPAVRAQALDALARFWAIAGANDAKALGDVPLTDMSGQAALMNAYLVALATPPDYRKAVDLLAGFEEKYPKLAAQEEAQVVKLRLAAMIRLGDLPGMATEAARPVVAELDPDFLDDLVRRLIDKSASEQARGNADGAAAGKRAARLLAERALASKDVGDLPPAALRRLQSTLAALYEQAGEPAKALPLYRAVLAREPDATPARAGAARILEAEGKVADARALWDEVATAPDAKSGWLEARYQSARLSVALGDTTRACTLLREVPANMLTGSNAETPKKIQDILRTSCAKAS